MKPVLFALAFVAANIPLLSAGFAQRQSAAGSGPTTLSPTGSLGGVDMSASGGTGTLIVGTVGGPRTDIFTLNTSLALIPPAVASDASSTSNIRFNSSSNVYGAIGQTPGPFFLNISAGALGATVNFLGPVYGTTLDVGAGTVNFNSGSINTTATNFAADGTIRLAPNTTVIGALTTTAGANTGRLILGGGSVLNGAVGGAIGLRAIDLSGGTATITGAVNAYSFNLGTSTLNIGGALTMPGSSPVGGIISTTLASPSVFGNIRPVGATNLGATLQINVTVPATSFIPVGSQFNIVQTQTGTVQSGTNGSVVLVSVQNPTNPLYTFTTVPLAGTIAGLVTIQTTGTPLQAPATLPPGVTPPAGTQTAIDIVPVLLGSAGSTDIIANILPAIGALTNTSQVVNALAQLAPSSSDLAAPLVMFQVARRFEGLVSSRLDDMLCDPVRQPGEGRVATCKEMGPRSNWWLKGFGYAGSQGTEQGIAGYDATIVGTMIGYDVPLDPNTRVGMGIGFARSFIDGKSLQGSGNNTSIDTYKALVYIGHESGPWFVHGDASFGWDDYTGSRQIQFPGVSRGAKAAYSGQDYTALATTGYHFFAGGFTITPIASLQYTHIDLGSYAETGAGDIGLRVGAQSYNFLESSLGAKVAYPFQVRGVNYIPEAHAKWYHELINPTVSNTAAFSAVGSPSFTTSGIRTADDTFNVGAGLTILSCGCASRAWAVEAVYDYYWRADKYAAQQVMLRFTAHF
jgi:outer membrane autotransporter protein